MVENRYGFTIIEVLIVLAIASLIVLIVFLAVPELQRSANNTARKAEASRIAAEIVNYEAANGHKPQVSTWDSTDCQSILDSSSPLNFYAGLPCAGYSSFSPSFGSFTLNVLPTQVGISISNTSVDGVMLFEGPTGMVCNGSGIGNAHYGTEADQMALMYTVQTGAGDLALNCLNIN